MAYNNYFPAGYQPYYPQPQQNYPQQQNNQPQQIQQSNTDMKWIQGEAAAKSYLVAPGQTVTLWDTESKTIYIKSANAAGMPSMMVLDYTERTNAPQNKQIFDESEFATKNDLQSIKDEINALRAKFEATEDTKKESKK